ncbi:MAG: CesT family type III secretion system chaperone [Chlamydiae bacterium]|nr:CesT family type III secretion system chaperone [Chlamydiota bacterium]
MDRFGALLNELSQIWQVDLYPEKGHLCRINYKNEIHFQLEYQENKERILVATFISDIPPGKYREQVLKNGLKYNNRIARFATLAYSDRNNQLVFYKYIYLWNLTGQKLALLLEKFIEKADEWKMAVEKGSPLPTEK